MAHGQTTQALISGRVVDMGTGLGISGAQVSYASATTNDSGIASSDRSGHYVLPLLSPGLCRIRVSAPNYQPQELHSLELPVAGRLELDFQLRLLTDVWQAGQYRSVFFPNSDAVLTFFGPDVDTSRYGSFEGNSGRRGSLESTVSYVIDPSQLRDLPLAGRDVYTMLVAQPDVTSDATTSRGLGLSVNGQRPSASNFLLDGLELNNYVVTGPLIAVAPEAVQEYRVSTNNYSAEYGRSSGYLANAITQAGGTNWHGLGYYYLKNEALNANSFQDNRQGTRRRRVREHQFGFRAGGPLWVPSLFTSTAVERLQNRSFLPESDWLLPSTRLAEFAPAGSLAVSLLERFPPPSVTGRDPYYATLRLAAPVSFDRTLLLQRIDYQPENSRHRVMARFVLADVSRPDFSWTPYADFVSGLTQDSYSAAFSLTSYYTPRLAGETRAGWTRDDLNWDRPHPDIPTLVSADGTALPGSLLAYAHRNKSDSVELVENLTWSAGRHVVKIGGGVLLRRLDGALTAGRDGYFQFRDILEFAFDTPNVFQVAIDRLAYPNLQTPEFPREYSYNQYNFFAQDAFRATRRLVLNYGLRYENFGAPSNTGSIKDAAVVLGPGASLPDRIASARLEVPSGGSQRLFDADTNSWAGRFGLSYDLSDNGRTVLRGGYGIFYDRPFDNLWQLLSHNKLSLTAFPMDVSSFNYLRPVPEMLADFEGQPSSLDFPHLGLYQPEMRDAYVQSYFLGIQHQISGDWAIEVNGLGSLGRKLITTDELNRLGSRPLTSANPGGRLNPALPPISYRANQGSSNFHALSALLRYRARRAQLQLAYTYSHAIDNQSEPLTGDFFDLSFIRLTSGAGRATSAFARQFDSSVDRGNSDFDQRHNVVIFSIWDLPGSRPLLRNWRFSQLAAFRTGFPYSVSSPSVFVPGQAQILHNRADFLGGTSNRRPVAGGELLLDRALFSQPQPGQLGNTGRNAFRGPGLYNIDLSLSRSFGVPWLGESGRLTFRADAYNILNHANLGNPDNSIDSETFGVALYGRQGKESTFPGLLPFVESPRQLQLMLRVEF
jgi:hypothetical protein